MSVHCVYCGQLNDSAASVCGACGRVLPPPRNHTWSDPTDPATWPPATDPQRSAPTGFETYGSAPQGFSSSPSNPDFGRVVPGGDQSASSWSPGYAPTPPQQQQWQPPGPSWQAPSQAWQPTPYGAPAPGVWQPAFGQQYMHPEAEEARSRARTSMILGIVGLFCMSVVLGPVALTLGIKSRATLQRYGIQDGQGMAMAGIVMGTVDIVLFILYLMAMLANIGR